MVGLIIDIVIMFVESRNSESGLLRPTFSLNTDYEVFRVVGLMQSLLSSGESLIVLVLVTLYSSQNGILFTKDSRQHPGEKETICSMLSAVLEI